MSERFVRRIERTLTEVAEAAADAEAYCAVAGAEEEQCLKLGLALDELAANALTHGATTDDAADIRVEVWADEKDIHLRLSALGRRFDPRLSGGDAADPDGYGLGGRGLALVLSFADQLGYERDGDRNVTTFRVSKSAGGGN